jgi:1A family penicillin-binding protein
MKKKKLIKPKSRVKRAFQKVRNLRRRYKIIALILIVVFAAFVWLFWGMPLPSKLREQNAVSTKIFDRNGQLIYEIYADKKRTPIKLDELPDYVKQATISIEDKDFFKHPGFSITGMARAFYKTIFQSKLQGGSTLTQQLVKTTLLTPERNIKRKIRELFLSLWIEATYSKEQILEMYLNEIPYGSTAYGIESASELYFNKSAKDLNLSEAALLAGLTQAPSRYSPFGSNPDAAKSRQELVLKRMHEEGYITQEQLDEAKAKEIKFSESTNIKAPHFALWIKEQLAEKYGDAVVEKGGLRVKTTLDLELQEFAQNAVATEVAKLTKQKVGNGAALVTKPETGEILAMVGSKDYNAQDEDGKVNVIFSKRQPGSSIKPLNYALGIMDEKITASTAFADVPTCFSVQGQAPYCPDNYDGSFHGATQTRFALANSYNIPAVRALALNGLDNFIEFAQKMGITTFTDPSQYGLSLTLGGGEVRPIDLAQAFGVFATGGVKKPLTSILKVEDWNGKVYEEVDIDEIEGDRIIPEGVAFIISHILHDNGARSSAFGTGSFLNVSGHPEVSVKTGTTNDRRDNWTVGYTKDILALTWVGNNDNEEMSGAVSGVSGASPIWNKIIKKALDKYEEKSHAWPKQPNDVVGAQVCSTTGTLPVNGWEGCPTRFEYFLEGTVPSVAKGGKQDIQVDKTTGALAGPNTPPENIETRNQTIFYDLLNTAVCLDCAAQASHSSTIKYPL